MRTISLGLCAVVMAGCAGDEPAQQENDAIGCGTRLEDRTAGLEPLLEPHDVEVVAELPYPPGNVAVAPDGRIFFSFHPAANKGDIQVAELVDGEAVPFPNDARFQKDLNTVLSVRVDNDGKLWMLDYADFGVRKPRLIAVDVETEAVAVDYTFPRAAAGKGSMLNDFQISADGKTVFITDPRLLGNRQALVVVDMDRDKPIARRRLVSHHSVRGGGHDVYIDEQRVQVAGLVCPGYGVDGLALDPSGEWLYYAPLNSGELWRASTHDLRYDQSGLLDDALAGRIEKVADITMTDGMATDDAGRVYLTDMEHSAIMRVDTDGKMEMIVQHHELLRWPDGLAFDPQGRLYVTASSLESILPEAFLSDDDVARGAPYHIVRIDVGAAGASDVR